MSVEPEIEKTADGSHTLFISHLNEHYHSVNGAIQESEHVFINAGLHHTSKNEVRIFEVGFGTGLNAFLTLLDTRQSKKSVYYTSIESYPLPKAIIEKLNYSDLCAASDKDCFGLLHDAEWNKQVRISEKFYLQKLHADFTIFDFDSIKSEFDIIYFDAFAPDKQPHMWTQNLFDDLFRITSPGGVFVTYCAKGVVRRMLQQSGYKTERLPGPPGKREMLRAIKPA